MAWSFSRLYRARSAGTLLLSIEPVNVLTLISSAVYGDRTRWQGGAERCRGVLQVVPSIANYPGLLGLRVFLEERGLAEDLGDGRGHGKTRAGLGRDSSSSRTCRQLANVAATDVQAVLVHQSRANIKRSVT